MGILNIFGVNNKLLKEYNELPISYREYDSCNNCTHRSEGRFPYDMCGKHKFYFEDYTSKYLLTHICDDYRPKLRDVRDKIGKYNNFKMKDKNINFRKIKEC